MQPLILKGATWGTFERVPERNKITVERRALTKLRAGIAFPGKHYFIQILHIHQGAFWS